MSRRGEYNDQSQPSPERLRVKMVERGEGTLKTLKGKTRTLNGHNRSTWYDGELYLM